MSHNPEGPADVAYAFLTECVDRDENPIIPESIVNTEDRERFHRATRFFRFALCVLILLHEEETNGRLAEVRGLMEATAAADGIEPEEVRWAMNVLLELLTQQKTPARWAHDWFNDIGIENFNPVTLTLFACAWMDLYTRLRRIVAGLELADSGNSE